jgi:4a-hydroxytetrahydrobiopterin dehydratase
VPQLDTGKVRELLSQVPGWQLTADGRRIARTWRVADFTEGLDFFRRVGDAAEAEGHHPDLHLANYRDVIVELWTHAAGGLTENDFILAAKINEMRQPKLKG